MSGRTVPGRSRGLPVAAGAWERAAHQRWVAAAMLAGAMLLGGTVAFDVVLGLALVAGAAFAVLLWYDLRLAIALWVVLLFLEASPLLNAGGKAAGVVIGLGWAVALPRLRSGRSLRDQRGVLVALALLGAWLVLSLTWTVDVRNTLAALAQWAVVAVAFLVVATGMADRGMARLGAMAFVVGAVMSVVFGAAGEGVGVSEEGRFQGMLGDPNILAAALVPAIVLALGLTPGGRGPGRRAAIGSVVVVLGVALAATGSRGGLVGAGAALGTALVVEKRHRAALLAASVAALAAMGLALWLYPSVWERSDSAGPGSGRGDLWTVAWHVAGDYPLTGVGPDNYPEVAGDYVREVGPLQGVDLIAVDPHEAHSLYLQLLSETGVVGLALFLAFSAACLRAAWRAAQRFAARGDPVAAALARSVLIADVGILVSAVFISAVVDRRLWVLLALGPALLAAARPDPAV